MDGNRFDSLTRAAASAPSRRALVKTALGGVLALAGVGSAEAARLREPGEVCRKDGDCATNNCGPKDPYGRQRCLCNAPADCPQSRAGDPCHTATCTAGVCGLPVDPDGTSCGTLQQCTSGTCAACTGTTRDYVANEPAACSSAAQCCQQETTNCEDIYLCLNGAQCCHPSGGSCSFDCDCCGTLLCSGGVCGGVGGASVTEVGSESAPDALSKR